MDDKMMQALLQSYGAPMNARNANIARNFFASNPDIAERRAMGLRGSGLDDNSDLLDSYLEKMVQADMNPTVQTAPLPPPTQTAAPAPVQARVAAPSRSSSVEGSPVVRPPASSWQGEGDTNNPNPSPSPVATTAGGQGDNYADVVNMSPQGDNGDWLLALLGISAAGGKGAASNTTPQLSGPGDQKRLTFMPAMKDESQPPITKKVPAGGEMSKTNQNARTRSLQEEIDLDNRMLKAQMDQIRKRNLDQKAAEDLARAARRATGRR